MIIWLVWPWSSIEGSFLSDDNENGDKFQREWDLIAQVQALSTLIKH